MDEVFLDPEERLPALVIDDDRAARMLACALLEETGFLVEQASDGMEGLSAFERLKPGIVLLDVVMPKMDGFAVCKAIRKTAEGQHIPILMMTGLDDIESINRGYQAGATDFITKPINWAILRHRLRYMWRANLVGNDLRKSEMKNRALINALPDLLLQVARDGRILELRAPDGFDRVFPPEKMISKRIEEAFPGNVSLSIMEHLNRAMTLGEIQFFEHQLQIDEQVYYLDWRIVSNGGEEALAIVRDITERKQTEERVIRLAYHDSLTGLLNRHSFKDLLTQSVALAQRHGRYVATLFLDLDRFKRINDTLGYNVGDLLLQGVADRIQECVRKSDRAARNACELGACRVSRLGGDEFTILLPEIRQVQDAALVARRILETISRPFLLAGHEIFINGSMGITVYPLDGEDADTLLKNADSAMYSAKEQGRNNFQFYSESMNASSYKRLALETSLRKALDREEFRAFYQPQIDIASGKITGMEALIRWKHPEIGLVPPNDFIPLAEETGLIVSIGEWVLSAACIHNKALQDMGLPPKRVAVNISSFQFRRESLVNTVKKALKISGLDPCYLELELTESAIMKNMEESSGILHELKSMGLRVAIDDFGTGYSSLAYLKRFPLDILKIDRSFIMNIPEDQDNAAIATAIIAMAHSLNLEVIAEGVESREQYAFLRELGCDGVQGFLFSPALPKGEISEFLKAEDELTSRIAEWQGVSEEECY
jgi:diguanylate cyclase (GGDEF)-like protein